MKTLNPVNLEHKRHGLKRHVFGGAYHQHGAVISNIRALLHGLGYDCSLLMDAEILAFWPIVQDVESGDEDTSALLEVLDFNSTGGKASK